MYLYNIRKSFNFVILCVCVYVLSPSDQVWAKYYVETVNWLDIPDT